MDNVKKLREHLLTKGRDKSYNELAELYQIKDKAGHISGERVRGMWRRLKVSRDPQSDKNLPKVVNEDGKKFIDYSGSEITTLEDLVDTVGVNLDFWDVKSFRASTWQDFNGDTKYAVRASFDQSKGARDKVREEFIRDVIKHAPKYKPVKYPKAKSKEKVAYEVNLPDLHLGKLSWGKEVGHKYDVNIAKDIYVQTVDRLLAYSQNFHIDKIIFPIGNDLLNSEGLTSATTKGTPQQDDVRWQRSFTMCREMLVEVIDTLTVMR